MHRTLMKMAGYRNNKWLSDAKSRIRFDRYTGTVVVTMIIAAHPAPPFIRVVAAKVMSISIRKRIQVALIIIRVVSVNICLNYDFKMIILIGSIL
ncbi:MAG: hypothetical protein LBG28_14240 [Tannerella sp.]|jgi:hypothetical protein|nr:hypothetical protein [Tannerella sp.]